MQTTPALNSAQTQNINSNGDFQQVSLILRERGWLIGVCATAGLCAAALYVKRLPLAYEALSVLQISPRGRVLGFESDSPAPSGGETGFQTILETFKSQALMAKVSTDLELTENPQFSITPLTPEAAQNQLRGCLEVRQRRGTQLIDITARHSYPEVAQSISNSVAHAFIQLQLDQRSSGARAVLEFLMTEADKLKTRLKKSEEALQSYKESNQATSLEDRQDTVITALKVQASNLASARGNRIRLETDVADMERFSGEPASLLRIASVAQQPRIASTRGQIAELQSQISTLRLRYTEKHPKFIQTLTQLHDAERSLQQLILQTPTALRSDLERAVATEASFEKALKEQEKQALALNRQSIDYKALARDVDTDRAVYEAILRKIKETDVARGVQLSDIRIFEPASLPSSPTRSSALKFIAIGAFAGIVVGGGAVFAQTVLESAWRTADEVESATGLPVLGSVPRLRKRASGKHLLERLSDPSEPILEAFRSLRTSLHLSARKQGKHCFLFAGAQAGDGKSFCSTGYALTLARQGVRTLLIDADLRSPSLEETFLKSRNLPGLTQILEGQKRLSEVIVPTSIPNLDLLPAGNLRTDASELLTRKGMRETLESARQRYDCLILDSAPVQAVSDSLLLAQAVDSVLLVVRYASTPRKAALRAIQLFEDQGTPVEGIVINNANPISLYNDYTQERQQPRHSRRT